MKNSVLIALAICVSMITQAQDFAKWRIGVKLNPNISKIKPDDKNITNEGSVFRFGFGLMVDKHFTANYAISTGLSIYKTGGQLTYLRQSNELNSGMGDSIPNATIARVNRTYRLQYFEIPICLKLKTNEIGYITYWAQFGLGLGFNIKARGDDEINYLERKNANTNNWEATNLASKSTEDEDISDDVRFFRVPLIVGGGIEYNLSGSTSILAGLTYSNGITNSLANSGVKADERGSPLYETNKNASTFKLKGLNNFFEFNVGIIF